MNKLHLKNALKEAMKAKDKVRLDTLRGVLSAIQYEEMEKKVEDLSADAVVSILQREMKRRKEELEFAEKGARLDLIEKFKAEISIIESFLPKQLSSEQIEKIVSDLKNSNPSLNLGGAMKHLKDNFSGQYDAKVASELCRRLF